MRRDGAIVIVDDSPADRELIELCLRTADVKSPIRALKDGAEAIAYLKGDAPFSNREKFPYPTLLITDLKMDGQDGFAVLEFLRAHPELAVIPTIVLSGSSDSNDVAVAYALGASSYIVKPSTAAELSDRIKALLNYWSMCEAPLATRTGMHVQTATRGKIGERYSRSPFDEQSGM